MKVVFGLVFIVLVLLVCARWVLDLGRLGFMMIGIAICVPSGMACVLNLHGSQRYWAFAPAAAFVVLVVLIFREQRGMTKG